MFEFEVIASKVHEFDDKDGKHVLLSQVWVELSDGSLYTIYIRGKQVLRGDIIQANLCLRGSKLSLVFAG